MHGSVNIPKWGQCDSPKPICSILSYKFLVSALLSDSFFWTWSSTALSFFLLDFQKYVLKLSLGNSRICQLWLDFIVPKKLFILSQMKSTFMVMIRFLPCEPRKICHRTFFFNVKVRYIKYVGYFSSDPFLKVFPSIFYVLLRSCTIYFFFLPLFFFFILTTVNAVEGNIKIKQNDMNWKVNVSLHPTIPPSILLLRENHC